MEFLEKFRKYDFFWLGIILGIALPIILFPIIQPMKQGNLQFLGADYRKALMMMLPKLLSRCVFPNALLFFLFIWNNFTKTAKGILYSTGAITIGLILLQLFFKIKYS